MILERRRCRLTARKIFYFCQGIIPRRNKFTNLYTRIGSLFGKYMYKTGIGASRFDLVCRSAAMLYIHFYSVTWVININVWYVKQTKTALGMYILYMHDNRFFYNALYSLFSLKASNYTSNDLST